jgi:hypothetical protein
MTEIDPFSLTTVPLELFHKNVKRGTETPLGTATSFVWKHRDNKHFLITNWHVVSGRDAQTRKSLKSHSGRPNLLRAYFNYPGYQFGKIQADIYIRDQDDAPLWFIHPTEGAAVDVVAIPLKDAETNPTINLCPINPLSAQGLKPSPSCSTTFAVDSQKLFTLPMDAVANPSLIIASQNCLRFSALACSKLGPTCSIQSSISRSLNVCSFVSDLAVLTMNSVITSSINSSG